MFIVILILSADRRCFVLAFPKIDQGARHGAEVPEAHGLRNFLGILSFGVGK